MIGHFRNIAWTILYKIFPNEGIAPLFLDVMKNTG
jgi:hypothetical protein